MSGIEEPPDGPKEVQESWGRLWLAEFRGGPLDGTTEVWEYQLKRRVVRQWWGKGGPGRPYAYQLREPVQGGYVEYLLCDPQPDFLTPKVSL